VACLAWGSERQPADVGSTFGNEATGRATEPDQQPAYAFAASSNNSSSSSGSSNKSKMPLLKRTWNRIAFERKQEISGGGQASGQVF
jgi:hypothetical protein